MGHWQAVRTCTVLLLTLTAVTTPVRPANLPTDCLKTSPRRTKTGSRCWKQNEMHRQDTNSLVLGAGVRVLDHNGRGDLRHRENLPGRNVVDLNKNHKAAQRKSRCQFGLNLIVANLQVVLLRDRFARRSLLLLLCTRTRTTTQSLQISVQGGQTAGKGRAPGRQ